MNSCCQGPPFLTSKTTPSSISSPFSVPPFQILHQTAPITSVPAPMRQPRAAGTHVGLWPFALAAPKWTVEAQLARKELMLTDHKICQCKHSIGLGCPVVSHNHVTCLFHTFPYPHLQNPPEEVRCENFSS